MTAELDKDGKLTVKAHTDVERYALKAWAERFKEKADGASLVIDPEPPEVQTLTFGAPITTGTITYRTGGTINC